MRKPDTFLAVLIPSDGFAEMCTIRQSLKDINLNICVGQFLMAKKASIGELA